MKIYQHSTKKGPGRNRGRVYPQIKRWRSRWKGTPGVIEGYKGRHGKHARHPAVKDFFTPVEAIAAEHDGRRFSVESDSLNINMDDEPIACTGIPAPNPDKVVQIIPLATADVSDVKFDDQAYSSFKESLSGMGREQTIQIGNGVMAVLPASGRKVKFYSEGAAHRGPFFINTKARSPEGLRKAWEAYCHE